MIYFIDLNSHPSLESSRVSAGSTNLPNILSRVFSSLSKKSFARAAHRFQFKMNHLKVLNPLEATSRALKLSSFDISG